MRIGTLTCALVALLMATAAGCSDDHDHDHEDGDGHGEMPPSCEAFHEACVRAMASSAAAAACDEFTHGEGRTEEECAAKKDECVAACTPP